MKKFASAMYLLLVCSAAALDRDSLQGAWLEDRINWVDVPKDINPGAQWTQAAILYFGRGRKFGRVDCTVSRMGNKWMTISRGDPRGVYKGQWKGEEPISVKYRLVEATILPIGQKLPGPTKRATVTISGSTLIFEGKKFHREKGLDKEIEEALYGIAKQ